MKVQGWASGVGAIRLGPQAGGNGVMAVGSGQRLGDVAVEMRVQGWGHEKAA